MRNSIFRKTLLFSILFFSFLQVSPVFTTQKMEAVHAQTESDEEAFLIRRIAEFWKDGDYGIVKTQILDFLDKYPSSCLKDYFLGILGDIYLQENHYKDALAAYRQILDSAVVEKIIINKLQCYYELDQFQELAKEGQPFVDQGFSQIESRKQELYFLMGEALFRRALNETDSATRQELAREAKNYYNQLDKGQYEKISKFALTEIHAILGDHQLAAKAYRELAEKYPEMKEDLLFQSASLEAKYNRVDAVRTFTEVKEMEGKRAQEAAFNLMVLLFQTEKYEQVVASAEKSGSFCS